jgi:hypothetical protein
VFSGSKPTTTRTGFVTGPWRFVAGAWASALRMVRVFRVVDPSAVDEQQCGGEQPIQSEPDIAQRQPND